MNQTCEEWITVESDNTIKIPDKLNDLDQKADRHGRDGPIPGLGEALPNLSAFTDHPKPARRLKKKANSFQ
ncbi:hypothetical protein N7519_009007 [Penicillium mononematosum]|uniref:uncharacterized protein n=1 Tax=Penicillium mononematosum TaxID=268346 RepID=UPI0025465CAC|nr:uncharacterized protein N7519_009007 [Penicillium mononematosum]KAJ6178546.1 hypothetical protein N7519_009007 [Penicillium mononematosum]